MPSILQNPYDVGTTLFADILAGQTFTLLNDQYYTDGNINVYRNGQYLEPGFDYLYEAGTGFKTQITVYDANWRTGDRIRVVITQQST